MFAAAVACSSQYNMLWVLKPCSCVSKYPWQEPPLHPVIT